MAGRFRAPTDWGAIFDQVHTRKLSSGEVVDKALAEVHLPLSEQEIEEINRGQQNPFTEGDQYYATWKPFHPSPWKFPKHPLPPSYVEFLKWSNGGQLQNGERLFQFLGAEELRENLLAYHVPEYMPLTQPFALNGGGKFFLFDMRLPPKTGEFPILFASCGALHFGGAVLLGESFEEVLRDGSDPEELLYG